jgi:nucleotide-binding universal stress UspA family protein
MKSILFPTDFSKDVNISLQYAIQFAKEKKCKLIFFHAFYDPIIEKINKGTNNNIIKLEVIDKTNKLQDELKKTYSSLKIPYSNKNIEVVIQFGKNVIDLINQTISEKKIDLVIIGTHHITGIKSILFENKAVKLISASKVPVLAIPIGYKFKSINKIIYSTDLLNTKKELEQLNTVHEIFKSELGIVYFDNGIAKTKQELESLNLIKTSGITFTSIRVEIDSHMITNLKEFIKNKRNSIVCLFHSPKNLILKLLRISNIDELALNLNSPLLSIRK